MATAVSAVSSATPASQQSALDATKICEVLEHGRETQRSEADRLLRDPQVSLDRDMVREKLLKLLASRYRAEAQPKDDEAEKLRSANTRAWLLYILPFVAGGDAKATTVMDDALDFTKEPNKWCRYWALVGQIRRNIPTLSAKAAHIIQSGDVELCACWHELRERAVEIAHAWIRFEIV